METFTKWYIPRCPLATECSSQSWTRLKKCQPWQHEEESKQILLRHLMSSWHHEASRKLPDANMEDLVACTEVLTDEVPKFWFDAVEEPPPKKQKVASPQSPPQPNRRSEGRGEDDTRVAKIAAIAAVAAMNKPPSPT